MKPTAATGTFPFADHRTVEQVIRDEGTAKFLKLCREAQTSRVGALRGRA